MSGHMTSPEDINVLSQTKQYVCLQLSYRQYLNNLTRQFLWTWEEYVQNTADCDHFLFLDIIS